VGTEGAVVYKSPSMSDWYEAHLSTRRPEGEGLSHLEVDVTGTPLVGSHLKAGQYVKLHMDGKGEAYYALASAPHRAGTRFELLVKAGSALADALSQVAPGTRVRLSLPQGKGFPVEEARGKNVLLVATGSGISPIRSVIELIRTERTAFKDVALYFGARTPRAFAYADRLAAWEKDGIRVVRVVSQPGDSGWSGLTGYVQTHLGPQPQDTVAFVCGQKGMVQAVTESLVAHGVVREQIHLNF